MGSTFHAQIIGELDLSKAKSEMDAFLNGNHVAKIKTDFTDSSGKSIENSINTQIKGAASTASKKAQAVGTAINKGAIQGLRSNKITKEIQSVADKMVKQFESDTDLAEALKSKYTDLDDSQIKKIVKQARSQANALEKENDRITNSAIKQSENLVKQQADSIKKVAKLKADAMKQEALGNTNKASDLNRRRQQEQEQIKSRNDLIKQAKNDGLISDNYIKNTLSSSGRTGANIIKSAKSSIADDDFKKNIAERQKEASALLKQQEQSLKRMGDLRLQQYKQEKAGNTELAKQTHQSYLDEMNNYRDLNKKQQDYINQGIVSRENVHDRLSQAGKVANQTVQSGKRLVNAKEYDELQKYYNSGGEQLFAARGQASLGKYSYLSGRGGSYDEAKKQLDIITETDKKLSAGMKSGSLSNDEYTKLFNQRTSAMDKYNTQMGIVTAEQSNFVKASTRLSKANSVRKYMEQNTRAAKQYGVDMEETAARIENAQDKMSYESAVYDFNRMKGEIEAKGLTGKSIFSEIGRGIKQIGQFAITYGGIEKGIDTIKQMATEVLNVDTAMTELRKVSDASDSEVNAYFATAAQNAKEYGSSVSDIISSTADFSRLGYSLSESEGLSKVATLYKNVGDGIDIETATNSIVSTMKAFGIQAEDSISIVDKFNEVGNKFAISSGGIGEAFTRSASSMAAAGNTIDETIGLVTGANEIVQDPDSIGKRFADVKSGYIGQSPEMDKTEERFHRYFCTHQLGRMRIFYTFLLRRLYNMPTKGQLKCS